MAKKKVRRKTARKKTTRKKTTHKKGVRKKTTKTTATKRDVDLSRFSESQLQAALTHKRSTAIEAISEKRAELMERIRELDRQIQRLGGSAPRAAGGGSRAGRGELAVAVLRELRRERTPKELLAKVGHLIGGSNKGAIISQKLMTLRDQGKIMNVKRGVWTAK